MFAFAAKIAWLLAQPLIVILILLLAGTAARLIGWFQLGSILSFSGVILLLVSAVTPLGTILLAFLEDRFPQPNFPKDVAGIVVLGGALDTAATRTRGHPELNEAADRMTQTLSLAARYPSAKILFTGGITVLSTGDISEAAAAEDFFREQGLAPGRLILESRARDTYENATLSLALAKPKTGENWLLVTSAFHMPRSVGCFRKAGFPVIPFPVDFRTSGTTGKFGVSLASLTNTARLHLALREYLGLFSYWMSGRTSALIPAPAEPEAVDLSGRP